MNYANYRPELIERLDNRWKTIGDLYNDHAEPIRMKRLCGPTDVADANSHQPQLELLVQFKNIWRAMSSQFVALQLILNSPKQVPSIYFRTCKLQNISEKYLLQ